MTRKRFRELGREIKAARGDARFWRTIDAVSADRRAAGRAYFTDAEWERIFIAQRVAIERGDGVPEWVFLALRRQREQNEFNRGMGINEASQYVATLRADQQRADEKARAAQPVIASPSRSSSGRTRVA